MKNKNLLNEMQKNDFKDKLIELGEEDFINWVENIAYKIEPYSSKYKSIWLFGYFSL